MGGDRAHPRVGARPCVVSSLGDIGPPLVRARVRSTFVLRPGVASIPDAMPFASYELSIFAMSMPSSVGTGKYPRPKIARHCTITKLDWIGRSAVHRMHHEREGTFTYPSIRRISLLGRCLSVAHVILRSTLSYRASLAATRGCRLTRRPNVRVVSLHHSHTRGQARRNRRRFRHRRRRRGGGGPVIRRGYSSE